jgi:hypothetical protein
VTCATCAMRAGARSGKQFQQSFNNRRPSLIVDLTDLLY